MDYKIYANHAHVFPDCLRPNGTVEKLLELMDACEVEKAVCFAPFEYNFTDCGMEDIHNEFLADEIAGNSRLIGFGTLDFKRDDIERQVEKVAEYGFKGIKIHPAAQKINLLCENALRAYAAAEQKGLFLSFHTGVHWCRIADYNTLLYDEIANRFPKLRFSMEHFGGYHFFREALAVIVNNAHHDRRNVYAGWTTMAMGKNGLCDIWSHTDEELLTLVNQTGSDVHIFGLDFPYNDIEYTKKAIERIKGLDLPEETKAKILGGNLANVLSLDL